MAPMQGLDMRQQFWRRSQDKLRHMQGEINAHLEEAAR